MSYSGCFFNLACWSTQVMIYELADHIQGFLSEHNKPPPRSFHEEMLKNQRRQQEKRAQEEQQRMDQQRKQEEEMVRMQDEKALNGLGSSVGLLPNNLERFLEWEEMWNLSPSIGSERIDTTNFTWKFFFFYLRKKKSWLKSKDEKRRNERKREGRR